jgi:membrane fusion protein (multidrug efflux system)
MDMTLADTHLTLERISVTSRASLARAALAAGALLIAAALPPPAAAQGHSGGSTPAVSVIVAKKTPYYQQFSYTGRIRSLAIVNIRARVTGYLQKREFEEGGTVKKGQLLFVIEQAPYQAALDQAQANVEQAKAKLRNAKLALARAERLLHTPAGQQSTVDNDRATEESDAAAVAAAKAQRETAAINYGYTMIRAPITGRIGPNLSSIGNVVSPGSGTMATIVSEDPMEVV